MVMHIPTTSSIQLSNHLCLGICMNTAAGSDMPNGTDGGRSTGVGISFGFAFRYVACLVL